MPPTEEELSVRTPLPTATFITSVLRREAIGHPFVRVTLRGGDLDRFSPVGADQFLYLLLPPPGRTELTIDASFDWRAYRAMAVADRPVGAYYTVRHYRPHVAEVDLDIVVHGHLGCASRWAARARQGDPVALWGPRTAYHPPRGTGHQLLVGDETALPAIFAICEAGPPGRGVTVVVEVDPRTVLDVKAIAEARLIRLDRPAHADTGTSALLEAIESLSLSPDTYAWGGGEGGTMDSLRDYVRRDVGLPARQVSMIGYWRREA